MSKKLQTENFFPFFWFTPGVKYIAFYPSSLNGPLSIGLPSPISYVPVFNSQLSDHMNLWGRFKNLLYSLFVPIGQYLNLKGLFIADMLIGLKKKVQCIL